MMLIASIREAAPACEIPRLRRPKSSEMLTLPNWLSFRRLHVGKG
jgi:hypothetical protein